MLCTSASMYTLECEGAERYPQVILVDRVKGPQHNKLRMYRNALQIVLRLKLFMC